MQDAPTLNYVDEQQWQRDITIPSHPVAADTVQDRIVQEILDHGFDDKEVFSIRLALAEGLTNAIKHGNKSDASKNVRIRYSVTRERFDIMIIDEGPGFDPADVPNPIADENLDKPYGRGVFLMKKYMTHFSVVPHTSILVMSKMRSTQAPPPDETAIDGLQETVVIGLKTTILQ